MRKIIHIFYYYLLFVNTLSIIIMYYDKRQAVHNGWRIPEKLLFMLALIFGSAGILSGMYLFHHKTKHIKFTAGIPLIMILQVFAALKYIFKLI